jgi:hypothetical protein
MSSEEILERAIAYHEAAHAIFAHRMTLDVVRLSIIPEKVSAGGCEVDRESYFLRNIQNVRNSTIELIIFFLAGKIAERKYLLDNFPNPDAVLKSSSIFDDQEIEEMISINNANGEVPIDLDELDKISKNIVNTPHIWQMIQSLSDDLFQAKVLEGPYLDQTLKSLNYYGVFLPNLGF